MPGSVTEKGTAMATQEAMLVLEGVTKRFGGLIAVDSVSFRIPVGSIVGLIGPNGSGKSVLLSLISGLSPLNNGRILFRGEEINGLPPHIIAQRGVGRTFQLLRLFRDLTVRENLELMQQPRRMWWNVEGLLRSGAASRTKTSDEIEDLLEMVGLKGRDGERAGSLSYGEQKLVALLNVLCMNPEPHIILLDEPVAGVNPGMITSIIRYIRHFRERGKTFLVVEHDLKVIMDLCDSLVVLDHGRRIAEGTPAQVRQDHAVLEAYFGR